MKKKNITANIDADFDNGKDVLAKVKEGSWTRDFNALVAADKKRVNFDVPAWILKEIDAKAKHLGFSRSAYIQHCLIEKLGIS